MKALFNSRLAVLTFVLVFMAGISAAVPVKRHFGTESGLTNNHIRDLLQDRDGFMWFATWAGVDRFDGYRFVNFRSFPSDSIKLDNNRIEEIAQSPDGTFVIRTYTKRIYRLDPRSGKFSLGQKGDADILAVRHSRANPLNPELWDYPERSSLTYTDRDGNLWVVRRSNGVDYICPGNDAVRFVTSTPVEEIGRDINTIYYSPRDSLLWAASRDTRIILYDRHGQWLGNLGANGRVVRDSTLTFGSRAYSFMTDRMGRLWIGTKSDRLHILTGNHRTGYSVATHLPGKGPGALKNANIYTMLTDRKGRIWLGTWGAGVVLAREGRDGHMEFVFPRGWPKGDAARIRRLHLTRSGVIVAATTQGIVTFRPDDAAAGNADAFRYHDVHSESEGSLSNADIQNIAEHRGRIYLSAFTGGIDIIADGPGLLDRSLTFGHIDRRTLIHDPVLSLVPDTTGAYWVCTGNAITRYDSEWRRLQDLTSNNLGRKVEFSEGQPQIMADGTIIYGINGGLMFVDPARLTPATPPRMVITGIETDSRNAFAPDSTLSVELARGESGITLHFAALEFAAPEQIEYEYRLDDGPWTPLRHERVLRLLNLSSGTHSVSVRSTDALGNPADNAITMTVHVPVGIFEILSRIALIVCLLAILAGATVLIVRMAARRRRRSLLEAMVRLALSGKEPGAETASVLEKAAVAIGKEYQDKDLRAERIARAASVTREELRHEFKNRLGVTIEDFIRRVRIGAAARLLRQGGLTVSEIAYRCGFKTPQYMSMVFKDQMGKTPSAFATTPTPK